MGGIELPARLSRLLTPKASAITAIYADLCLQLLISFQVPLPHVFYSTAMLVQRILAHPVHKSWKNNLRK